MNRILFEKNEVPHVGNHLILPSQDRRGAHIRKVLHSKPGDSLRVGIIDGQIGNATIVSIDDDKIILTADFNQEAPEPWLDILLAMPRPKVLHRLWAELAAIGFGRIILVNAAKVEKFYFDNHWLNEGAWRPLLVEGLEQSGTTKLPEVLVRRAFKPFIQDEIPVLYPDSLKLVAHPRLENGGEYITITQSPASVKTRPVIAIGPEGGWTDFELNLLFEAGFKPLSLGDRALRTDTACIAIAGALQGAYLGL